MRILLRITITLAIICVLALFTFETTEGRTLHETGRAVRLIAAYAFVIAFLLAIALAIVTIWVA